MSRAIATIKDDKILKYCYNCKTYEWVDGNGICTKCLKPIYLSDWVSRILFGGEK